MITIMLCFWPGSPRVGNYEFAQHYHTLISKSFLVVHANDIVTKLPPRFKNKFLKWYMKFFFSFFSKTSYLSARFNPTKNYYHVPQQIVYDKKMHTFKKGNPADGEG